MESTSLAGLLTRHGITGDQVAVLLVDAEGWDCKICLATDFAEITPAVVIFERKHCLATDREQLQKHLAKYYVLRWLNRENTLGIRKGF